jgi:autotransporter translocation and assembly factor TamB
VGPLRTGALTLRSEPARSQNDILAILLFGGSAADTAQQAKSNETGEWVVGGAAVTTGVNRVLSSVTPLDITTRVTSDSQSPTPEVAIQLSPKLTAEISYRTRTPTPLENQDRTLITLDWRFRRNWSIATTVGQQSTVLDLIWRYRY